MPSVASIAAPKLQMANANAVTLPKPRLVSMKKTGTTVQRRATENPANNVTTKLVGDFLSTAAVQPGSLTGMADMYYQKPNAENQRVFPVRVGGKDVQVTGHEELGGPMQSFFTHLDDKGVGKNLNIDTDYDYRAGRRMSSTVDGKLEGTQLPNGTQLPSLYANGLQFKVDGSADDLKKMAQDAGKWGFSTRDYSKKGYMLLTPVPEEVYSASRAKSGDHMNGGVIKHMLDMEK